jgi:hypothetical protein
MLCLLGFQRLQQVSLVLPLSEGLLEAHSASGT